MNTKLSVAMTKVKYFFATQTYNFYIGMGFAVFILLTLMSYFPIVYSVIFTPIITELLYLFIRSFKEPIKIKSIKQDILAVLLGIFWTLLFLFI